VASGLIGGATLTGLAIAVGLANYYILGLDGVTEQIQDMLAKNSSSTAGMGLLDVSRRRMGLIDVSSRRRGAMGLLDVSRRRGNMGLLDVTRIGSCVGCAPRF
jgi:hypothetical protein